METSAKLQHNRLSISTRTRSNCSCWCLHHSVSVLQVSYQLCAVFPQLCTYTSRKYSKSEGQRPGRNQSSRCCWHKHCHLLPIQWLSLVCSTSNCNSNSAFTASICRAISTPADVTKAQTLARSDSAMYLKTCLLWPVNAAAKDEPSCMISMTLWRNYCTLNCLFSDICDTIVAAQNCICSSLWLSAMPSHSCTLSPLLLHSPDPDMGCRGFKRGAEFRLTAFVHLLWGETDPRSTGVDPQTPPFVGSHCTGLWGSRCWGVEVLNCRLRGKLL